MNELMIGLSDLGSWSAIGYLFAGAILGMVVGVIPGLSSVVVLSIILVFAYHIDVTGALCLFIGAKCGGFYSASVASILLNAPSHPEALPITFDGYPMARKGRPSRALGISACATCVGGLIGCAILVGFMQFIDVLPGLFHPPEYLALITLAMLLVGTLGTESIAKCLAAIGGGLLLSSIGSSSLTGTSRYTFGVDNLESGLALSALVLGIFAIPQMIMVFGTGTATANQDLTGKELAPVEAVEIGRGYAGDFMGGVAETFRSWGTLLQSGVVGGITGMIPGIGGFAGNMMAYSIARTVSRRRDKFGTGIPEGVIAPEGSSLAKEAGHMIPIIALGIPGGVVGALFMAVLAIKGMATGFGFQQAHPGVLGQIVWIIALSGIIATVTGALLGSQIAKVTKLSGPLIVPFIFAFSVCGVFLAEAQFFDIMELLIFAIVGLALRRLRYPLGSFVLGLVLGPQFETNISLTRNVYGASWLWKRPLTDVIFVICIVLIVWKALEIRKQRRTLKADFTAQLAEASDDADRAELVRAQQLRLSGYPLLSLIVSLASVGISLFALIYGLANYDFTTGIMPEIAAASILVPSLYLLPTDIRRYVIHLRVNRRSSTADSDWDADEAAAVDRGGLEPTQTVGLVQSRSPEAQVVLVERESTATATVAKSNFAATVIERSWGRGGQYRRELAAFGWLCLLVGLCGVIGFEYGIVIFVLCYGLTSTRIALRSIYRRALFTIPSTLILWFIIHELFILTQMTYQPLFNV